jgi:hypothetical protein
MNYEWIHKEEQVDKNQIWFPALDDIFIQHLDISDTLCISVGDFQLALIQGYRDPNIPNTWLVQRAYFADANPRYKRLWLRTPNYHEAWARACNEMIYNSCVIKFAKGSSIELAYGKNTLDKFPQYYKNLAWWETEDLSFVRFDVKETKNEILID